MLVTFFKSGESPKKFGFDGVNDIEVDYSGSATIVGVDKLDNKAYIYTVLPSEYSYFTLHKEDKEDE